MSKPLVHNLADSSQVKDAEKKVKFGRERELEDMKYILSLPQGQRMMWRYLEYCQIYKDSFTGNSSTFYNEGRRMVGVKILEDITEASPEIYIKMLMDNKEK